MESNVYDVSVDSIVLQDGEAEYVDTSVKMLNGEEEYDNNAISSGNSVYFYITIGVCIILGIVLGIIMGKKSALK